MRLSPRVALYAGLGVAASAAALLLRGGWRWITDNPDRAQAAAPLTFTDRRGRAASPGVLGAYGSRVKRRYGKTNWYFEAKWDDEVSGDLYKMPVEVAEIIEAL